MALSSSPPSGFRDFLPSNIELRQKVSQTISRIYRSFGFEPIETSALENLEVLTGKGGGENEKLIFKVLKRGEKLTEALEKSEELADLGLRFDLTLPLARFYAAHQNDLPKPFKAFHIAPVWRAERAQRGRYREFTQCDLDIVGSESWMAEVEVISAILTVFEKLGIKDVSVHLNDRALVYETLNQAGIPPNQQVEVCITLDKLDKIGEEGVFAELHDKFSLDSATVVNAAKLIMDNPTEISKFDSIAPAEARGIKNILEKLKGAAGSQGQNCFFNSSLMRGFDYYTGPVFEFRHPKLSGSLGGGGRYDRLLEKFGVSSIAACGGSIGFERLILLLEELGNSRETLGAKFFIAVFSEEMLSQTLELSSKLRNLGQSVDLYPGAAKLKNQFKYADQKKARYALILGPDEAKQNQIRVKDLKTGIESLADFESLPKLPD